MAESEQPQDSASESSTPPPSDENLSLSDFEAKFHGDRREASTETATPPAESPEPEPSPDESAEAEADRDEKGRFLPRKRHRAASQEATPQDVPRIRELTARLRAAEAERDALKTRVNPPTALATPPPPPVSAAPKPTPDQFDDYGAYVEALTDWKTDQKLAAAEQKRHQAETEQRQKAERDRLTTSWKQRVDTARAAHPDFDEVALESDTPIPAGSLIDAWILEHKTGAEMLYFLQQHPDQIAAILQQPVLEQAESLALLAQRFNGQGRPPAAVTGSAAASPQSPPPKPPNPVRTGPVRAGDEPPDPEKSSLADHEKWYAARSRRGGGSARA